MIDQLQTPLDLLRPLKKILVVGSWIVGCTADQIVVWKSADLSHYTTINPIRSRKAGGDVLSGEICGMPTFLNKVFVGKLDGSVEMWNISTARLVYTFQSPYLGSAGVTALQPSPKLSVLAIGRENGSICLHDVQKDRPLLTLSNKDARSHAIVSISFRTDGMGAGKDRVEEGTMATAAKDGGDISLWDLTKGGRISGVLYGAHNVNSAASLKDVGSVSKIEFLPGQDIMITSGPDNALKSWIFDANSLSSVPRILHQRCGHSAPLTKLAFVPSNSDDSDTRGKWLMSAARDHALWAWSLRRDGQSSELSQGSVQKKAKRLGINGTLLGNADGSIIKDLKAPEILHIASSLNRDGGMGTTFSNNFIWNNSSANKRADNTAESFTNGWESVVTGHRGDNYARTWFWGKKKAGRWALETGDGAEVTSVAMTSCGTFALVGSAGGNISMYNLQSGMRRQTFPSSLSPSQARRLRIEQATLSNASMDDQNRGSRYSLGQGKHTMAVTGLAVDNLNRTVISCSLDGKIKFWDFQTGQCKDEIDWHPLTAIIGCQYHRPNDLFAFHCDDLSIRVIDAQTRKTVREFWGCRGQISDFCFSNDGRWIIAASMDSVIRVWDLPTGHLISAMRVDSPCIALAFSDTGEYLATAHIDNVGINVWNNRALFTHVPTRPLAVADVFETALPTSSGESGQGVIDAAFESSDEDSDTYQGLNGQLNGIDALDEALQSLSLVPKSRWQTLLHLDTIRERNRPLEPPKVPEKAPFFLPSLTNSQIQPNAAAQSAIDEVSKQITNSERSRISILDKISSSRMMAVSLRDCATKGDFSEFIRSLSNLSPSVADVEIRSLNQNELVDFVQALTFSLRQRNGYELVQTWMAVFLRIHGDNVAEAQSADLIECLERWNREQMKESKRLNDLVGFCGGVLEFVRSVR